MAVRGGGHSAPGYATCDAGVVIDLSPMKHIDIDSDARTARAEAGLTWGEFDAATQEHGLAVTGGRFSTTGIAGLTLGSGSGWLERKCGLTADNLLSADVVTAAGERLTASADENADLFWGIRGGSGNFGIVTAFEYRLHEVGPIVYGGPMFCMPDRAGDIMRFVSEYMPSAPDDLGGGVAFINAPPEPFIPAEIQLQPMVGVIICWTGTTTRASAWLRRSARWPSRSSTWSSRCPIRRSRACSTAAARRASAATSRRSSWRSWTTRRSTSSSARRGRAGPMAQLLMEPMRGAISATGEDETALGRRDVPWCYHALAMWLEPDPETADAHVAWAKGLAADLKPHTTEGVYLNYISDDEGEARVRSSYGPKYDRLVALKDRYDPDNLFRLNQNIRPSATGDDEVGQGVRELIATWPARVEAAGNSFDLALVQTEVSGGLEDRHVAQHLVAGCLHGKWVPTAGVLQTLRESP